MEKEEKNPVETVDPEVVETPPTETEDGPSPAPEDLDDPEDPEDYDEGHQEDHTANPKRTLWLYAILGLIIIALVVVLLVRSCSNSSPSEQIDPTPTEQVDPATIDPVEPEVDPVEPTPVEPEPETSPKTIGEWDIDIFG